MPRAASQKEKVVPPVRFMYHQGRRRVVANSGPEERCRVPIEARVRPGRRRFVSVALAVAVVAKTTFAKEHDLRDAADFRVRMQAALRLGKVRSVQARLELEAGLSDTHPAVRVACAVALAGISDAASLPALQRASVDESVPSAKASMDDAAEKIRVATAGLNTAVDRGNVERAKYIVKLGFMRDTTGQRNDLDATMRALVIKRARSIKDTFVLDNDDEPLLRRAAQRKIPVLLVDANVTRLSQATATDGSTTISAQVDLAIRRVPQHTLRGMVSGSATASERVAVSAGAMVELQNRAVTGAIESAMATVGSSIAALAK
jgi:hypothetical protein